MSFQTLVLFVISVALFGCDKQRGSPADDDINSVREDFLNKIFLADVEEGPFHMHYTLKTIFFSQGLISLFGEINVYDSMPHGWKRFEGKTYAKIRGQFREIRLKDLFSTESQREFLRNYCESSLKKDPLTYLGGENPLRLTLDPEDLGTFVVNDQYLIIIFQPYVAVSSADSPFIVKIPFDSLQGHWDSNTLLVPFLRKAIESKDFVTSEGDF